MATRTAQPRPRGRPKGSRASALRNIPADLEQRFVVAYVSLVDSLAKVIDAAAETGLPIAGYRFEPMDDAASRAAKRRSGGRTKSAALRIAADMLGMSVENLRAIYYAKGRKKRG